MFRSLVLFFAAASASSVLAFACVGPAVASGLSCAFVNHQSDIGAAKSGDRIYITPGLAVLDHADQKRYVFADSSVVSLTYKPDGVHIDEVGHAERVLPSDTTVTALLNRCIASPGADLPAYLANIAPTFVVP